MLGEQPFNYQGVQGSKGELQAVAVTHVTVEVKGNKVLTAVVKTGPAGRLRQTRTAGVLDGQRQ